MREDIIKRLTSRKFLAAVAAGTIAVLAAAGVIDPSREQELIAQATPLVYILVEGVIDFFNE